MALAHLDHLEYFLVQGPVAVGIRRWKHMARYLLVFVVSVFSNSTLWPAEAKQLTHLVSR